MSAPSGFFPVSLMFALELFIQKFSADIYFGPYVWQEKKSGNCSKSDSKVY
jgi:hypothetical protein